jgi:alkaline phosphatase D
MAEALTTRPLNCSRAPFSNTACCSMCGVPSKMPATAFGLKDAKLARLTRRRPLNLLAGNLGAYRWRSAKGAGIIRAFTVEPLMRIAFASCLFTRVFAQQPVWDDIRAQKPDALVLLGDATYFDLKSDLHPQLMDDPTFAQHLHALYSELLAQPQFANLVKALPKRRVFTVWDDHDFLWNDAEGAEVHPVHTSKVRLSTAFHEAFRAALANGLGVGSFPATSGNAKFWNPAQPALTTPSVALSPTLQLHLSDGRTFRTRTWLLAEKNRALLGAAQRSRFAAAMAAKPDAVHLFASGSTFAGYQRYTADCEWLLAQAAKRRMLMLSGDIHRNAFDAFHTGGFPLHEATSSGAAVKDAVVIGRELRNFGVLDVDKATVTQRLFSHGKETDRRVLGRAEWLPVAP